MRHIKQWHRVAVVAAVMSLVCSVSVGAYDFSAGNIYYNINEKTLTAEVTYASDSYNSYSGMVVVPANVNNNGKTYNVVAVGDNAFRDCTGLTGVILGPNVATIGNRAFLNCSALTAVNITVGVTEIGDYAFAQCSTLNTVIMNNDAPLQVGNGAFMRCSSLNSVKWNSAETLDGRGGLTSLGTNAFAYCTSLTKITLPGDIQHLGTTIFDGCTSMKSIFVIDEQPLPLSGDPFALASSTIIYVPSTGQAGVTASLYRSAMWWRNYRIIEMAYSFYDHDGYTYLKTSSGTVALKGTIRSKNDVVVRNSITDYNGNVYYVTSISDQAFRGTGVTTLNTSNAKRLTTIGNKSFADCASLTDVSLIEGITMMGDSAFASCTALDSIQLPSTLRVVPNGAFDGCSSLGDVDIWHGVTTISEHAFAHCTSLTSLSLPSSVSSVEGNALYGSTALEEIFVASNSPYYASIGGVLYERKYGPEVAPDEMDEMEKLTIYPPAKTGEILYIPPGVTEIEAYAIQNAAYLKHVAIPPTTTVFGENCFEGTALQTINYRCKQPSDDGTDGITATLKANTTLQVPVGTSNDYKALSAWQGFKIIVERYDVCGDEEFVYDWNSSHQVTLVDIKPAAVQASGKVTLPLGMTLNDKEYVITELKNTSTAQVAQQVKNLVLGCDSLAIIDLTDDINPLAALTSLEAIYIGNNSHFMISDNVLYSKKGKLLYYYLRSKTQESFNLPAAVDTIMPQAFASNDNLKVFTASRALRHIGNRAFEGCAALLTVDNVRYITGIGNRAFACCAALSTVNGGERLGSIGSEAFLGCSSLRQFPFAHGMLVEIGDHAFKGCSSLTVAVLSSTLAKIGDGAFENCTALSRAFFISEVSDMGHQLFKGCTSLSELWLSNTVPPQVGNDYFASPTSVKLYVPKNAVSAYHSTSPWSNVSQVNSCHYLDNGPDVNNDRSVNAFDVTLTYSVLLGDIDLESVSHCDVNHDGAVTAADITIIYDFILNSDNASLAYSFVDHYGNNLADDFYVSMDDGHKIVRAFVGDTNDYVTTGLSGVTDNTNVANVTLGTSQGVQYLDLVPVAPGYFTMVGIVNNGTSYFYRAFPMVVQ